MDWKGSGIGDNVFGPSATMQMARGVAMDNKMLGKGDSGKRSYSNRLDNTTVANALPARTANHALQYMYTCS